MVDNGDRQSVLATIRSVIAASYACTEGDLIAEGVVVTEARELEGRLRFTPSSNPLLLVTMGADVVVSAHSARVAWLRKNLGHLRRDEVFSATTIAKLVRYAERDGQSLSGPELKFACSRRDLRSTAVPDGVQVTIVEESGIAELYRHEGFNNALSYQGGGPRAEVMAAVATRGGTIIGIAGASQDSDYMWQIGVDVVKSERGGGVGQAVVQLLTKGILDRGKVPYYTTVASNIPSRALAGRLGYWPAWNELYARDR